ncbi:MAG: hypothetical protein U9O95_03375 [Candidatus Marinimicrobia bacterium]|nr:hypothetical protein [Candidatus Neomarinimicrobiota bacterium]
MQIDHLNYDIEHQELFRESRNDTLLSRYTLRKQNIELNYQFEKFSFFASWSGNIIDMADMLNTDYTNSGFRPGSNNFDLKAQTKIYGWLLQPGIHYSFSRTNDTLFVTDFPVSEMTAYNNYFFNLLPETFGDTIPYHNASDNFHIELLASDHKLMFYLKYSNSSNRLTESHINTSSNDKLNGPRESLCKFTYSGIKAFAGGRANKYSFFWLGLNYNFAPIDWKHTVFPSVPDTLEIIQIADGKTQSFNTQFGYHLLSFPFNLQTAISIGFIKNSTRASTPVLGYVLKILPISHQAELDFASTYLLAHVHFDYPLKAGKSIFTPRIDMIASRFRSDVSLLALLQFGLEDIDIQELYVHAAYIASIGCEAKIALNRDLFLTLEADQLLPYVKTISPEPPPPIPSDIKRYGGLSISAGVSMSW